GGEIGYEPLLGEFVFNAEFERLDVEHWESFVERIEFVAHPRDYCGRARCGRIRHGAADVERGHVGNIFLKGEPSRWAWGLADVVVMGIGDDANNFAWRSPARAKREGEASTNRVFAFEKLASQ